MPGLSPMFNLDAVMRKAEKFANDRTQDQIFKLAYIGEEFVNDARLNGTYKNHTKNLRSSIGYVILLNGEVEKKNLKGNAEGKLAASKVIEEFKGTPGLVLIGFAGMEYAAAVESKKYDVITSSIPTAAALKSFFRYLK